MDVVYITWKGKHLLTMEKYFINKEIYSGTQIDDKNTVLRNRNFDNNITAGNPNRDGVVIYFFVKLIT